MAKNFKIPSSATMKIVEHLASETYWGKIELDWSGSDLDYKGCNIDVLADGSEDDWAIYKFTWSEGIPTLIQYQIGIWDDRDELTWS